MKTITFPDGRTVPALGQGTWYMGENGATRASEADALRAGIDAGMTLIDTAEMYADGGAEEVVGDAIVGRRDEVFIVSKVLPYNASLTGTVEACERSLRALRTDHIDLYLLHWQGPYGFDETIEAFEGLMASGKIGGWGVSNLDEPEMSELWSQKGGGACQTNQILYNLSRRGPEFDLLPWQRARSMPVMAYSPLEQGRILGHPVLTGVAARHGVTPVQIALSWVLAQDQVIAIPKAARQAHVAENRAAADIKLSDIDLKDLDSAFGAPTVKQPLAVL